VATLPVIVYLLFMIATEMVAGYYKYTVKGSNIWVYNTYTIISSWFWFYFITRFLINKKLFFLISAGILGLIFLFENLFFKSFSEISTITFSSGALFYTFLFALFSRRLFRDELKQIPLSWLLFLVTGLGYFIGFFLDTILYPTGMLSKQVWGTLTIDRLLVNIVNYFFSIGLIGACWLGYQEQKKMLE
jgi:hypothetical protein